MAVSIESGGGRGGRKSVDAELLLVPYIDLLTCMVAFLLISAVWTQLARLQVQQKGQGQIESGAELLPQTKIAVLVHHDGFAVIANQDQSPVPRQRDEYNFAALTTELQRLKKVYPDKLDVQILSEDAIKFEILVKTMDAAMTSGFPDISLLDAAGSPP